MRLQIPYLQGGSTFCGSCTPSPGVSLMVATALVSLRHTSSSVSSTYCWSPPYPSPSSSSPPGGTTESSTLPSPDMAVSTKPANSPRRRPPPPRHPSSANKPHRRGTNRGRATHVACTSSASRPVCGTHTHSLTQPNEKVKHGRLGLSLIMM